MNARRSLALLLALGAGPAVAGGSVETYAYLRGGAGEPTRRVPLLAESSARVPVATVDDTAITVSDLAGAIAAAHEDRATETHAGGRDAAPLVERLVTLRLFVAEAREMGLDEQPGFKKAVAEFKEQRLRELAERRATRDARPDAMEVERLYKDAVREWRLRSLLFEKREDAVAFRAAIAEGKAFSALAREALARRQATGTDAAEWVPRAQLLPAVAQAVTAIDRAPACTDPIAVKGGWAVAEVQELRYPEDPKARATAEATSLERVRVVALEKYRLEIERRFARTDQRLWKALDFEATRPGFAALAKDRRAVVRIEGESPVTVADVAAELEKTFFHGIEEPRKQKKLNAAKIPSLHKILTRRLFLHAARQAGIPSSPEFRRSVAEYEDSLLFGSYVQKVVMPGVKVTEDEGQVYYAKHKAEFTFPAFYRLEALAFATQSAADAAMKQLAARTDFGFLRANAEGQVKPDDRILALDGQTFSANTLPPELVQALAGARPDDVRAYSTAGQAYVVRVLEVTPPKEQPYLEARAAIAKTLAGENLNKAVKDVAAKLRPSHQVAVFLERIGN